MCRLWICGGKRRINACTYWKSPLWKIRVWTVWNRNWYIGKLRNTPSTCETCECNHCYFSSRNLSRMKTHVIKDDGTGGELLHLKMARGKNMHWFVVFPHKFTICTSQCQNLQQYWNLGAKIHLFVKISKFLWKCEHCKHTRQFKTIKEAYNYTSQEYHKSDNNKS